MDRFMVLVAILGISTSAAIRDVPLGECHMCEVTCFEDCMLKYDREILQTDFLQIEGAEKNKTAELGKEYAKCLVDDKCPCEKEDKKNKTALLQGPTGVTKKESCPLGEVSCAQNCSRKVVSKAEAEVSHKKAPTFKKKQSILQREYPIHSVKVGVFSKGTMNMDQCLKFCLAATCGCDKAPGLDTIDKLFNAIKQNDAAAPGEKDFAHHSHKGDIQGAVMDTHGSKQFRPAKIEECAKGMIGKKVSKGLYVDFGGGVGGELEICTPKFMEKIFGPGDHSKKIKLCKSTKSDDSKWGCIWNDTKDFCMVGFAENLRCQVKYFRDPTMR